MTKKRQIVIHVLIVLGTTLLLGCVGTTSSSPAITPLPTHTPYPTYTPQPTYTPYPTPSVASSFPSPLPQSVVDIAQRQDLVNAINDFRVAQGRPALNMLYPLMQIAASRVYLGLVPVDLGKVQIDPRVMPSNYKWQEWTAWGDSPETLTSLQTAKSILDYWLTWQGMPKDALTTEYTDIGATYLCNGIRCAFVIIYGGSQ